jgi:formate hydrogenlyase subunit 6/NADH:ubiquinone oxidoreductase subunit I
LKKKSVLLAGSAWCFAQQGQFQKNLSCSLCKAACPQNAIDFEENFSLAKILEDEPVVVARIKLTLCLICGEIITAGKNQLCPTCRKRQVRPMYVKV